MKRRHNPNQTRRHRLIGHDYADPGYYFVTFGTHDGQDALGTIENDELSLSATGYAVSELIACLPETYDTVQIDCFAVMPNHVHLLIYFSLKNQTTVSEIVRSVKGPATVVHRREGGVTPLWHKGFHDAIVRNDRHLEEVRRYIGENPMRWKNDDVWW